LLLFSFFALLSLYIGSFLFCFVLLVVRNSSKCGRSFIWSARMCMQIQKTKMKRKRGKKKLCFVLFCFVLFCFVCVFCLLLHVTFLLFEELLVSFCFYFFLSFSLSLSLYRARRWLQKPWQMNAVQASLLSKVPSVAREKRKGANQDDKGESKKSKKNVEWNEKCHRKTDL
jgi:hypothetical protein